MPINKSPLLLRSRALGVLVASSVNDSSEKSRDLGVNVMLPPSNVATPFSFSHLRSLPLSTTETSSHLPCNAFLSFSFAESWSAQTLRQDTSKMQRTVKVTRADIANLLVGNFQQKSWR